MMDQNRRDLPTDQAMGNYQWGDIPTDTCPTILEALGGPDANRYPAGQDPVRVVRHGVQVPWPACGQLTLEDGTQFRIAEALPSDLPLGYHEFCSDDGPATTSVIVTPGHCPLPRERQWGWAAQLYAARSAASWGMGDLADLRRLATWSAGLEADVLMINPLCAVAPVLPQTASPYYPASRRFLNPLYLRVEEVPGADRLGPRLEELAAAGRALNADRHIDRDAIFRLKREALKAIWAEGWSDPALDAYCRQRGEGLKQFATYCVVAEEHGDDWRYWPIEYRDPRGAAVQDFARAHAEAIRYHQWLQWATEQQLARAASVVPLVCDLPIGFSPGGADAWAWQDLLAQGCTVGAPPDPFAPEGQDWQLPPFVPAKLRAARYQPFIETIRASLRHAAGLRIDHVMGLFRLFWIPVRQTPAQGTYVRYPADELLSIVALESHRAEAFVVGEDLGTVEDGVRERLARYGVLSFRLLWFERERPPHYPEMAMAAISTHDLPTIAGLWTGWDLAAQEALGLPKNEALGRLRAHYGQLIGVPDDATLDRVIVETYRLLAQAPSRILLATLEDGLGLQERPNMPGTTTQWPNWLQALPGGLESLQSAEFPAAIAQALKR